MLPTTRYGMPSVVNNFHIEPADSLEPTARVLKSLFAGDNFPTLHDGIAAIRTLVAAYASSDNQGLCIDIHHTSQLYEEKIFLWA